MKSEVFTQAWKLVKGLGYSLSYALKISWAHANSNNIGEEMTRLENQAFGRSANKERLNTLTLKARGLSDSLREYWRAVSELVRITPTVQSNAPAFDYGNGQYNGD